MTITTQQARQRFTIISTPLQDAVFSVQTAEIMEGLSRQYHLDDAKVAAVGKIVSWVLLGFIHPEDVAREIQGQLNIPSQAASEISKSIDVKLFAALRDDLNKAYAPVPEEAKADGPQIIAAPAPKIISETFSTAPKFAAVPSASNRDIAAPAPQVPKPQSSQPSNAAGWSKATSQQPVVKLGAISSGVPAPAPKTISMPPAAAAQPSAPKPAPVKTMSEFERLDLVKKNLAPMPTAPIPSAMPSAPVPSTPTPTSAKLAPAPVPATPPSPAPVMLHQVSSFSPIEQSSAAFNARKPAQDQLRGTTAQGPMPTRPAVVEFNNAASTSSAPTRSVPTPPAPMANSGPRQMTEIQAPQPIVRPPAQPLGPMQANIPMPATPPAASTPPKKDKVIVKDFLA